GRTALRFSLPDESVLKLGFRIDIGEISLSRFDVGHSLRKPRAVIPIVDPEQGVTRPNGLVVLNLYGCDITRNLWGERGHVSAYIGVVGRRRAGRLSPSPSGSHDHHGAKTQHQAHHLFLIEPRPRLRWRSL